MVPVAVGGFQYEQIAGFRGSGSGRMGVGEKKVVDLFRRHRELLKEQLWIVALGHAAVYQDIYAVAGSRPGLHQMAGAGYALFCSEMGDPWCHVDLGYLQETPPTAWNNESFNFRCGRFFCHVGYIGG